MPSKSQNASVAICMGSKSDWPTLKEAASVLDELGISYEAQILSAHRTPKDMYDFAESAAQNGYSVLIAGAGGAAHLPGMLASLTTLPVIGVPILIGELKGLDALLSIAQMPKGVPVACVAVGNAHNAGLLAAQILAHGGPKNNPALIKKLSQFKVKLKKMVRAQKLI